MENEIIENQVKTKKITFSKIFIIFLNILTFASGAFLIYNIYKISGIENTIRYIIMGVILLLDLIIIIISNKVHKKKSKVKIAIVIILSLLLIAGQSYASYFIYKTYSSIDNMNKDSITYTTVVLVKKDSKIEDINGLEKKKIGMVIDETSIDNYVLGMEIIKEQKLEENNEIKEYANLPKLIKDLYNNKIDAVIISKNYPSMFASLDKYKNIEQETKIIYEKSKKLTKEEASKYAGEEAANFSTSDKIDKPFTLLVMGIDSTQKELSKNATGNGDSLMLVTFNPKTLNATILSIPRDTYVPITCFAGQKENKITHAAWHGESCMIKTIENFTGIPIDYYVKINFQGVIGLVNALDGIEVDVPMDFCESNSKRSTRSDKIICLKTGKQKLNGEQALALARHRKTLTTGDLQRGMNQQLVVQGMLDKLKTIRSASQLLTILDTISKSMDTNFSTKQILSFYDIAKKLIKTSNSKNLINMTQLYLQGSSAMIYDEGMGMTLYNYVPSTESLNAIVKVMKQNLGLEKVEPIKRMDFNIEKEFKMETVGAGIYSGSANYSLLPSFIGSSESYAKNWLSSHGISVSVTYKETSNAPAGQVIDQSIPANKRLDLVSGGMTLTVAKAPSKSEKSPTKPTKQTETPSNNNDNGGNSGESGENTGDNGGSSGESGENTGDTGGNSSGDNGGNSGGESGGESGENNG